MTRAQHSHARADGAPDQGSASAGMDDRGQGRHASAVSVLEDAVDPVIADMGYELLLLEWLGSGKRRIMRVYLDHPDGISVADCSRMSRMISNALDASDAAAAGEGNPAPDPALIALLGQPYVLEVSSPGVERPLTRRRHYAAHVGERVKLETWAPLDLDGGGGAARRKFQGQIIAIEEDSAAVDDQRRGVVVVHDPELDRTLRIPLPRIRRANLVWTG